MPTPEEIEQLQVLLLRLEALQQMERQEANRLENSRLDAQTRQDIHRGKLGNCAILGNVKLYQTATPGKTVRIDWITGFFCFIALVIL